MATHCNCVCADSQVGCTLAPNVATGYSSELQSRFSFKCQPKMAIPPSPFLSLIRNAFGSRKFESRLHYLDLVKPGWCPGIPLLPCICHLNACGIHMVLTWSNSCQPMWQSALMHDTMLVADAGASLQFCLPGTNVYFANAAKSFYKCSHFATSHYCIELVLLWKIWMRNLKCSKMGQNKLA